MENSKNKFFKGNIKLSDKIFFAENLGIMLRSGLSISEALMILEDQSSGKMKVLVNEITRGVNSGQQLSVCLKKYPSLFSSFFINSIMSGEASGNLEVNLLDLAEYLKKDQELREKIRGAMLYPFLVLGLGTVIAGIVTFFVLPKITPIFKGLNIDLPVSTKVLIWLAELIDKHGIALALAFIIFVFGLPFLLRMRSVHPMTHKIMLLLPLIGRVSRNRNIAVASRTLSAMLKSGVSLDEALKIASHTVSNFYYSKYLVDVKIKLNQGLKFSECLSASGDEMFGKMSIGLVRVGERSGNLEEELSNIAQINEAKVEKATKNLSLTIEPILLIIIGLGVGWLALSIITPIYKITGNIY